MTRYFSFRYGWSGTETPKVKERSKEAILAEKIEKGTLTDADIDTVVNAGGELNKRLEQKYDQKLKEKRDLDEKYGKDVFDYKNENGELVKEVNLLDNLESYGREVSGPEDLKNSEIPQGPDPV